MVIDAISNAILLYAVVLPKQVSIGYGSAGTEEGLASTRGGERLRGDGN